MIQEIIFRPEARLEFLEACAWYDQQRDGLGSRFTTAVDGTLKAMAASPQSFPLVHRDVRRALVHLFPYGVFYRVCGETIHVLAVIHERRDPSRWKRRRTVN